MGMKTIRSVLIWAALATAAAVPLAAALNSPLLAWRDPVYIVAGAAGIVAMIILLMQPLLAAGVLPGLRMFRGRRVHRWTGVLLVLAVVLHVVGLWITSPPDMLDALLFNSPTPFSAWGVVAMWAIFATSVIAVLRRRLRLRMWRLMHGSLAVVIVVGTVVHAMLIEGTMEAVSKAVLCGLVLAATARALLGIWCFSGARVAPHRAGPRPD